ncbi:type 1 glutamine amidotransferase domain-containing protein [Corynebacterium tuberculostearicum]|uniref:type 1 glutamine amidotransferase domain-containing protein n=1 Tax=Corynebacterium tuberculostearicum TaxID=38304 RepID=UPI002934BF28|nr:type 1 glutamine amidotransferase domain-containing protein [Corynebacterium tuberculostearicum]MDV2431433.1 type 1 glutamine amidotransferase domain-containing protein [Corynebacterium tuberculostearicum]
MAELDNKTIAIIATDGFEDSELTSPLEAVKNAGATVRVLAPKAGTITGKNGTEISVDAATGDSTGESFDGIILPGGTDNADLIRLDKAAVEIVRNHMSKDLPLGAICHGAWILADAEALKGRTLTSFPSLQTDLRNAGATWEDEEVHCDQGLVSSRTPDDLPAFNAKLVEEFAEGQH